MRRRVPRLRNVPAPPVAAILVGVVGAASVLAAHTSQCVKDRGRTKGLAAAGRVPSARGNGFRRCEP